MKKRMLSLLLALTMIVGMLPLSALTATAASAKHYKVDNWGELRQVLEWDSGSTPVTITLTADIYEEVDHISRINWVWYPQEEPTIYVVGNKTLDLNGFNILCNDKSNTTAGYAVWDKGVFIEANSLYEGVPEGHLTDEEVMDVIGTGIKRNLITVQAGARLTVNDAGGYGSIAYDGAMAAEDPNAYRRKTVRDVFHVYGDLIINGGMIIAGRSKKNSVLDAKLDPTYCTFKEEYSSFYGKLIVPDMYGKSTTDHDIEEAWQIIWGSAVVTYKGSTFTLNGGHLYGMGEGLERVFSINNTSMQSTVTYARADTGVVFVYGGEVTINSGSINAEGGADVFSTTNKGLLQYVHIYSGVFSTEKHDYVRCVGENWAVHDSIITGSMGKFLILNSAWQNDLDNTLVLLNGEVYSTKEEIEALGDLCEASGELTIIRADTDGLDLLFTEQNPRMPFGTDTQYMYQAYGETTNFTFNHAPLSFRNVNNGYYVERNYVIRNAANKQVVASGSGILGTDIVNVTHTWNELGTFTLIEDLTLRDKTGAKVKSKVNTFHIFVQPAVDHIEITTPPTKTQYRAFMYKNGGYATEYFDPAGMVVTAYYTDGTTHDITKSVESRFSLPMNATSATISFKDSVFGESFEAVQPITVEKAYQISRGANGGAAYANERMNYAAEGTQLELFNTQHYDTDRYQLEGWAVTRDDNGEAVEVRRHLNGGSYYFIMPNTTVTINPIWTLKKVVESIQIQTPPAKTDYYEGQNFNPAGMALRVFYTDNTWEDIKGEALKQYLYLDGTNRYLKPTDTAILVRYNGFEVSQPITVSQSQNIYSIELTMDGYGYGKNVADFELNIDTNHVEFTNAGSITNGFVLDRWNGSSSATVTSGTFGIYEYDLSIAIQLDAGYIKEFTADTVTVNGIKARSIKSMGSGKYIIGFALPNFIVSEVNLTVADPTPGMTPNDFKVVIPGGSYYGYIGFTQWSAWDEKTQTSWMIDVDDKFAASVEYTTTLLLVPSDGFVFEDTWYELSATINGEAATITRNSNGTVSVNYSVVIPENPPSTLISNITSYVDEYVNVTVELYKRGESTPAYTEMVRGTTDNPALVVISGIEDGTYTMKVDKPYHKTYTTTITATGNTIYADVELEATSFLAVFHFGSDPIAWQEVDKGEKVIKPEDPAWEGKIFTGWYTADGQLYNFNTSVTDNVNLYARFDYDIDIDLSGDIHVNCVGKITYTVSGQTVTVNHSLAGKVGYLSGGSYVAITATKNGDGTYSFTAPAGVTAVVLVVKGDVSGDGRINVGDTAKLYSHVRGTAKLTDPNAIFAADVSGDGKLNVGDTAKVYSHVKATALLTW